MKKTLIYIILILIMSVLVGCNQNSQIEQLEQENARLRQQLENGNSDYTSDMLDNELELRAEWVNNGTAFTYQDGESIIEILHEVRVVNSSNEYILVMNFKYTNQSSNAKNFINDYVVSVIPYQNGVELTIPGTTSNGDLYDTNSAYTNIKDGATLEAQRAFVLDDITAPVEVEIGHFSDYNKKIIKTITITANGGE